MENLEYNLENIRDYECYDAIQNVACLINSNDINEQKKHIKEFVEKEYYNLIKVDFDNTLRNNIRIKIKETLEDFEIKNDGDIYFNCDTILLKIKERLIEIKSSEKILKKIEDGVTDLLYSDFNLFKNAFEKKYISDNDILKIINKVFL